MLTCRAEVTMLRGGQGGLVCLRIQGMFVVRSLFSRNYLKTTVQRVVADTVEGLSIRTVPDKYSVSPPFVSKITRWWIQEGNVFLRRSGLNNGYNYMPLPQWNISTNLLDSNVFKSCIKNVSLSCVEVNTR